MNEKKKDYLTRTLGFQLLVCVIIFSCLFALQKTDSSFFDAIKDTFSGELSKNLSTEDVSEAFKQLTESITSADSEADTTDTDTDTTTEDETLTANVLAEGGADISVDDEKDLPSNVSLEKYELNDNIFLPVKGTVTSPFGFRVHPISGTYGFHCGTDIAADSGTPIHAAFDGEVIEASYDQWNGNYVKLQHKNGIVTVYCHCTELFVKKGEVIRGGEVIASVGSTGDSTGPHLHFEFRINGISYDPQYALKDAVSAV